MRKPESRDRSLDALRGVACLMVLLYHLVCSDIPRTATGGLYLLAASTYQFWCGVDLFFVLSGFFIFSTLLANEQRPHSGRNYFIARLFRIAPPYVLLVLAYFYLPPFIHPGHLKDGLFNTQIPNAAYPLFAQAWVMYFTHDAGAGFVAVTWSLSVEAFLYIVAFAVVRTVKRRRAAVLVGLALLSWGLRLACLLRNETVAGFFVPVCRMDEFMMGGLVALARREGRLADMGPGLRAAIGAGVAIGLAWLAGTSWALVDSKGGFAVLVDIPVLGLFFACSLVLVVGRRPGLGTGPSGWQRALEPLSALGLISYSVYLFHIPFHLLFNYALGRPYISMVVPGSWLRLGVEVILLLVLCSLSYAWVERPMIEFGRRRSGPQVAPVPAQPAA